MINALNFLYMRFEKKTDLDSEIFGKNLNTNIGNKDFFCLNFLSNIDLVNTFGVDKDRNNLKYKIKQLFEDIEFDIPEKEVVLSEDLEYSKDLSEKTLQDIKYLEEKYTHIDDDYIKASVVVFENLRDVSRCKKQKDINSVLLKKHFENSVSECESVLALMKMIPRDYDMAVLFYNGITGATTSQFLSAARIYLNGEVYLYEEAKNAASEGVKRVKMFLNGYLNILNARN